MLAKCVMPIFCLHGGARKPYIPWLKPVVACHLAVPLGQEFRHTLSLLPHVPRGYNVGADWHCGLVCGLTGDGSTGEFSHLPESESLWLQSYGDCLIDGLTVRKVSVGILAGGTVFLTLGCFIIPCCLTFPSVATYFLKASEEKEGANGCCDRRQSLILYVRPSLPYPTAWLVERHRCTPPQAS